MNHFQLDADKYERHLAQFKTNADRMAQLLASIGSPALAQRALRVAGEDGRIPTDQLDGATAIIAVITEQMPPDTVHRPEPEREVDQSLLDELVDLLLKSFQVMRFSNFIIPPGGSSKGWQRMER